MPAASSVLGLSDLALVWDAAQGGADLVLIDQDLASDAGLETAMGLSLFTDRRAQPDDVAPSGDPADRRGWWADQFADVEGDLFGSRLWLLDRSKATQETLIRAREYALEALRWLVDDEVAASIDVATSFIELGAQNALLMVITGTRPDGSTFSFRFARVWETP